MCSSDLRRKSLLLGGCVALAVVLWIAVAEAGEPGQAWRPVTTVFHVHSDMSTGSDSIESLATQARSYGIEALILTDIRFTAGVRFLFFHPSRMVSDFLRWKRWRARLQLQRPIALRFRRS